MIVLADASKLLGFKLEKINEIIYKGCKLFLANRIKCKLVEKINSNFYKRYSVGDTGWLTSSLSVDVKPSLSNSSFLIYVYWDGSALCHTTWWGMKGINAGDFVYTPEWINDGYTFAPNGGGKRLNEIGGVSFIEDTIKDLTLDNSWINDFYNYLRKNGIDIIN